MTRPSSAASRGVAAKLATFALVFAASCVLDSFTSPQPAELRISANLQSAPIASLVVTVSASDINPSLTFNLTLEGGVATGTFRVPAGSARTLTLTAFDASGLETHRGSTTLDIVPGTNPPVAIVMQPIAGRQPIEATLGAFTIAITLPASLAQNETAQLTATVTGPEGPVTVAPGELLWATATPATLSINPTSGVAQGQAFGPATVVATYAGTAAVATIDVDPVIIAAGDIAECNTDPVTGFETIPPMGDAERETALLLDPILGTVLVLGDNAYNEGRLEEYMCSYEPTWGRHKARTYPVPGNHEYGSPNAAGYYAYFGARAGDPTKGYYSFDLGAWHIIALNSERDVIATGAQVAWLQADLAANAGKKCVMAMWHRPRFNSGERHNNDARVAPFWDALYAANADVILNGHEHLYERFAEQTPDSVAAPGRGIRQFTSGGGGAGLYDFVTPRDPNHDFGVRSHGVLVMTLNAESYKWRFINRQGTILDNGSANCH
jgi:calcineurin-like phosphoesterase family protein